MSCLFRIKGQINNDLKLMTSKKNNNYCVVEITTSTRIRKSFYANETFVAIAISDNLAESIVKSFQKGDYVNISGFMSATFLNSNRKKLIIKRISRLNKWKFSSWICNKKQQNLLKKWTEFSPFCIYFEKKIMIKTMEKSKN